MQSNTINAYGTISPALATFSNPCNQQVSVNMINIINACGTISPALTIFLNWAKRADGGASACTSQPWLKPIFDYVNLTDFCCSGGSIAKEGSESGK